MNLLEPYATWNDGKVSFTRQQASLFAKQIADDYNPIHDVEAKRFCVPGDLLFAVLLFEIGLYPRMNFIFSGMVADGVPLHFQNGDEGQLRLVDERGKDYLLAHYEGTPTHDAGLISEIIRSYVRFSGHNFPHILQPLMAEHKVMINIERPLVIYESMSIDLARVDIRSPVVELSGTSMDVDGKRGNASLRFRFLENGQLVGYGEKRMVLSGLREYEEGAMQRMVDEYARRKESRVI
jgi:hypothetical protein